MNQKIAKYFYWNLLLKYSRTQTVNLASITSFSIPFLAQLIDYINRTYDIDLVNSELVLAQGLYISGVLILAAKLLVELFCPERIKRFPYQDDHLVFHGEVREAQETIKRCLSELKSTETLSYTASLIKNRVQNSAGITEKWDSDNQSLFFVRSITGTLFCLGFLGMGTIFFDKFISSISSVFSL
jgi:hypothetical protein